MNNQNTSLNRRPTAAEIKEAFLAAMLEAGIAPQFRRGESLIADGRLHREHNAGDPAGSRNIAYKLNLDGYRPAGYFENFKTGIKMNWKFGGDYSPPSPEERQRMEAAAAKRRENDAQRYAMTAETARQLWNNAKPVNGRDHPYLQRKHVDSHGLRCLRTWRKRCKDTTGQWRDIVVSDVLLIPLYDQTGALWNVQAIFPEPHPLLGRDKDFLRGAKLSGLFFIIGADTTTKVLCEGYATGASIHAAAELQVFCAFSAGNLLAVARAIRATHPTAKIIIAADNDTQTPGNPGVSAATKAAAAVGGLLALPPIHGDFNDLQNMDAADNGQ